MVWQSQIDALPEVRSRKKLTLQDALTCCPVCVIHQSSVHPGPRTQIVAEGNWELRSTYIRRAVNFFSTQSGYNRVCFLVVDRSNIPVVFPGASSTKAFKHSFPFRDTVVGKRLQSVAIIPWSGDRSWRTLRLTIKRP